MSRTRPFVARPRTGRLPDLLSADLTNTRIMGISNYRPLSFRSKLPIRYNSVFTRVIVSKLHLMTPTRVYISPLSGMYPRISF